MALLLQASTSTVFQSISGKRVLVTGASSGIGAEIAKLFASFGACVGLHYNKSSEDAQKILQTMQADSKQKVMLFQGDLLDITVRQGLVADFVEKFGGIDILVNNAGASYSYTHFSELKEDDWDKTFTLNTKAPFCLSRSAFRFMKEQGNGRIINISSVATKYVGEASFHYAASKAALDTLTLGFSRAGAKYNILVNSICCGVIDTLMHTRVPGYRPELFQKRIDLVPVGHPGSPLDIARMALFLSAESGSFITGECLSVAGGD